MNQPAALRPLDEAADAIRRLVEYASIDDLAVAIVEVVGAIEESLRLRLGDWDPDLPLDEVVKSLRTRGLISLETAGTVHEARAARRRASEGAVRDGDAARARAAVDRLREELGSAPSGERGGAAVPGAEPPDRDVGDQIGGGTRDSAEAAGPGPGDQQAVASSFESRWMRWMAAAIAAVLLLGAVWMGVRGGGEEFDDALAAFRAGRVDSAAAGFERVLEERPRNITVMLYLARSYRRLERYDEAAEVLRRALDHAPEDADVRRELGHLFMDLESPASAVAQYDRALEYDPDEPLNWAALIRALRALDDPRAERLLRDAPAEVQAALRGA